MVCLPGLQYSMCTLCRYRSVLSPSSVCALLCREPISPLDVPISTNEAYELTKQAEKTVEKGRGGGGGGGGGGKERGGGGEERYMYEEVSAQSPDQPVAAGEVPSLPPLLSQVIQVPPAGEGIYELEIP